MTTLVHFNATTPSGRAVLHLLEKSALADMTHGIELRELPDGGRTLIVHPSFDSWASEGERALLLAAESLAGQGNVNLLWLLDGVDERCARAIGEAVLIAGGLSGYTLVERAS